MQLHVLYRNYKDKQYVSMRTEYKKHLRAAKQLFNEVIRQVSVYVVQATEKSLPSPHKNSGYGDWD